MDNTVMMTYSEIDQSRVVEETNTWDEVKWSTLCSSVEDSFVQSKVQGHYDKQSPLDTISSAHEANNGAIWRH